MGTQVARGRRLVAIGSLLGLFAGCGPSVQAVEPIDILSVADDACGTRQDAKWGAAAAGPKSVVLVAPSSRLVVELGVSSSGFAALSCSGVGLSIDSLALANPLALGSGRIGFIDVIDSEVKVVGDTEDLLGVVGAVSIPGIPIEWASNQVGPGASVLYASAGPVDLVGGGEARVLSLGSGLSYPTSLQTPQGVDAHLALFDLRPLWVPTGDRCAWVGQRAERRIHLSCVTDGGGEEVDRVIQLPRGRRVRDPDAWLAEAEAFFARVGVPREDLAAIRSRMVVAGSIPFAQFAYGAPSGDLWVQEPLTDLSAADHSTGWSVGGRMYSVWAPTGRRSRIEFPLPVRVIGAYERYVVAIAGDGNGVPQVLAFRILE